jgi:hypothetical protein
MSQNPENKGRKSQDPKNKEVVRNWPVVSGLEI